MLDFAKEKALWDNIRESEDFARHREEILAKYKASFEIEPSPHTVEEILGKDDHGKWARSLNQLQTSALMSLIYPDNEEYYNNLLKIVWSYLDTYTWAALGHYNSYYNRTPEDYDIGLIDIFAASVAFSLAEIKNLFSERFPQLIKDRISAELKRRTIDPFVNRKFFWEKHPNNWSSVCAGGVGGVHAYFGSSGWVGYTVPHMRGELYIAPLDKERDITLFSNRAIGLSFNWVVNRFYAVEKQQMGGDVYAFVDRDVATVPAGSEGVFAAPWFYGDRPPLFSDKARGCFLNLGGEHDRRHMTRAILEGVCYQLKMGMEHKHSVTDIPVPTVINAVGGGAGSSLWMQMLADVFNITIRVPADTRHAGAVGTAYAALIGLGVCRDYSDAAAKVKIANTYVPNPETVKVYEKGYAVFKTLFTSLKHVFDTN